MIQGSRWLAALALFFSGQWVLLLLEVLLIDAFDEPDSGFRRILDGDLEMVIRTPLPPDSTVESCCFRNLEVDCGDAEAPCWEDGGPDDRVRLRAGVGANATA